ncbi:MAG: hypothetical protein HOO06_10775 [Bdellovibrionaceae bacterium]|jgi:hypothetical protein|nr:hypothetical protein [Pseudobdellovibrionaceae bacterium]
MKLSGLIFIFVVQFFSLLVWAETQTYTQVAQRSINRLLEKDVTHVGSIGLLSLSEDIETVKWGLLKDVFALGSGKTRTSSVYIVEEQGVLINKLSLDKAVGKYVDAWYLHEAVGALGILDENYHISISIDRLSRIDRGPELTEQLQFIGPIIGDLEYREGEALYEGEGGITVVGGGGQNEIINFKSRCLDLVGKWLAKDHPQLNDSEKKYVFKRLLYSPLEQSLKPKHVEKNEKGINWDSNVELRKGKYFIQPLIFYFELSDQDHFDFLNYFSEYLLEKEEDLFDENIWYML